MLEMEKIETDTTNLRNITPSKKKRSSSILR